MAMTWDQKYQRRQARYWGQACLHNIGWTLRAEANARSWEDIANRMQRRLDTLDTLDAEDRESTEDALVHAKARAEEHRKVVEHQENQVKVNARRAAHAVFVSWRERPNG